jgi:hypothetical protein
MKGRGALSTLNLGTTDFHSVDNTCLRRAGLAVADEASDK